MPKRILTTLIVVAASTFSALAQDAIGFKEPTIADTQNSRSLQIGVWYPAVDDGPATVVGENAVFYGVPLITNA